MKRNDEKTGGYSVARGDKRPYFRDAMWLQLLLGVSGVYLWWLVYGLLPQFSRFLTYSLFNIGKGTHLGAALEFFFYDTPKVMMLLVLVVFGVGIIRTFFTPERTRDILSGKSEFVGNIMAASLGIVTPFCSCSAVPLFIGFVTAGVPLGVTFSFLIAAPLVNEIAVGLLYGLLGWKVAGIYMATGLTIAIMAGWVIGRLHLEKYIEEWVVKLNVDSAAAPQIKLMWRDRIIAGWEAVKEIVGKVWIYMIIGIAVGAGIHGYVPEGFLAAIMGKGAWWAVPAAVGLGVPMYSNAAGIIPVVEALLGKGAALGTVLAFMMSVIALSLPEMIILRKVLKPQLIAVFIAVVTCGILIVGYLFNLMI
ncbi:MAG: permease, partial [Deltaproteobacteria bacterium]|nr:permease [Deltaproteobacteria bacterium]